MSDRIADAMHPSGEAWIVGRAQARALGDDGRTTVRQGEIELDGCGNGGGIGTALRAERTLAGEADVDRQPRHDHQPDHHHEGDEDGGAAIVTTARPRPGSATAPTSSDHEQKPQSSWAVSA